MRGRLRLRRGNSRAVRYAFKMKASRADEELSFESSSGAAVLAEKECELCLGWYGGKGRNRCCRLRRWSQRDCDLVVDDNEVHV
jgi:hypothetical protein